ncbi:hypothetical protein D8674_013116 [Pyrus ussuriensis x Pyrus communis]|uniref:Uncharacterized protein n=1 Tax=Pyrus ussuriensis x Pyrus communis TaxID=2448454 RepID=A0A5N5GQ24_9ROSA|nr:hypothetical protein D8674_013116 [Pyrus ussuriensis x Pyrus communis]
MGKKPRDKSPSTPLVDGGLLHRSMTGIGAITVAWKDKTTEDRAPSTTLVESGLLYRSLTGIRAIAGAGK